MIRESRSLRENRSDSCDRLVGQEILREERITTVFFAFLYLLTSTVCNQHQQFTSDRSDDLWSINRVIDSQDIAIGQIIDISISNHNSGGTNSRVSIRRNIDKVTVFLTK